MWSSVHNCYSQIMGACVGLRRTTEDLAAFAESGVHLFMHAYRRLVAAAVTGHPGAPVLETWCQEDVPAMEPTLQDPAFAAILVCVVNTSGAQSPFLLPWCQCTVQCCLVVAPRVGQANNEQALRTPDAHGACSLGEVGVRSSRQEVGGRAAALVPFPHALALGAPELAAPECGA